MNPSSQRWRLRFVCLNPFFVRDTFEPHWLTGLAPSERLNPFFVRDTFEQSRAKDRAAGKGLNPFFVRDTFELYQEE